MLKAIVAGLFSLLMLVASTATLAAPISGLALSDSEVAALTSNKIMARNALIKNYQSSLDEHKAWLLEQLAAGNLYAAGTQLFYAQDGKYYPLSEGAVVKEGMRLKRVGTSNAQRKLIADLLSTYNLTSPDVNLRQRAVSALLEQGAKVPARAQIEALLSAEDDPVIYSDLRVLWALSLSDTPSKGVQETLSAIDILKDCGTNTCLIALKSLQDSNNETIAQSADAAASSIELHRSIASWIETLFFGLSLGSVLVLAAMGLCVTFGVMGVINMAHGELIMIGAYCVVVMQRLLPDSPGLALALAIPLSFTVSALVGVIIERTVISKLYGRPLETLLATYGVSLILQQAVRNIFSPLNQAVATPSFLQGSISLTTNLSVTVSRVAIIVFAIAVFFTVLALINHTRLGLEVRAISQNRPIARALGVKASWVDIKTFALGSGVAGLAGAALSQISNVGPNLGQTYIVDTFMVVVLGGVGNLWGTLAGGMIMGLASKFLEPVSGAMLSKILILVAIVLFIQKHPRGLFPMRGRAVES